MRNLSPLQKKRYNAHTKEKITTREKKLRAANLLVIFLSCYLFMLLSFYLVIFLSCYLFMLLSFYLFLKIICMRVVSFLLQGIIKIKDFNKFLSFRLVWYLKRRRYTGFEGKTVSFCMRSFYPKRKRDTSFAYKN